MQLIKHNTDGVPKGVKNDDLIIYQTQSSSGDLITHKPTQSKYLNWLKCDPRGLSKLRPSKHGQIVEYAIIAKRGKNLN